MVGRPKGIFRDEVERAAISGFPGKNASLRKCLSNLGGGCEGLPSPDGRHLAITDIEQSNNMWMMENF